MQYLISGIFIVYYSHTLYASNIIVIIIFNLFISLENICTTALSPLAA